MSVKDRLKEYIKSKQLTIKAFEESINASNGYVNSISKGIGKEYLEIIREKYPDLDLNWLLNLEKIKNLEKLSSNNIKQEVNQVPNENYMMVEYADLSTSAGILGGALLDNLPESKIRLVPREYEKGNYLVVRVNGDSMNDGTLRALIDGDEILIQEYFLNNGDKLPIRNNLFVIVSNEGSVIKQITEHNIIENTITCHSFNPLYQDFKLNLDDVFQIFVYKKIIRRKPLY